MLEGSSGLREFWRFCQEIEKPELFTPRHLARYITLKREENRMVCELYDKKKKVLSALLNTMYDLGAQSFPDGLDALNSFQPYLHSELAVLWENLDELAKQWLESDEDTPVEKSPFYSAYQTTMEKMKC